ncbi:MAG: cobyric acid synthase, partial [Synergistaceae bacterium]|nr:cobyric acid synthase [Synergistaceae bacterium]
RHFDAVIIEGAGSPAEINLNAHEIVNMRIAREADVDVILVADVDRGGSLASVAGTLELLDSDRERVKGIIYNKFRGNIELFKSAIKWTENYTGIKVIGVIPFLESANLSGEDSLNIRNINRHAEISIGIINFPGISNFGDFDAFIHEPDVNLIYIDDNMRIKDFHELDAIILPGTKNTFASLEWLKASGLDVMIRNFRGLIFGICGGMQIMGRELFDPNHIENENMSHAYGLNLIPSVTRFNSHEKITRQVHGFISGTQEDIHGYEIHYGLTHHEYDHDFHPLFTINESPEGITSHDMRIAGTYIHGIFGNDNFRSLWLNGIRRKKNYGTRSPHTVKKDSYDEIASVLAHNLDIDFILKLILHEDTMLQPE